MWCLHRANQGLGHAGTRRVRAITYCICHSRVPLLLWPLWLGDSVREGQWGCGGSGLAVPLLLGGSRHTHADFSLRSWLGNAAPRQGCSGTFMASGSSRGCSCDPGPNQERGAPGGIAAPLGCPWSPAWPFHRVPDSHPGRAWGMP